MDVRCGSMRGRAAGFSILEAVAAIVLLGIAVPPILSFLLEGARGGIFPERQTISYFLAMERMEEIIADRHSSSRGYSYLIPAHYPDESLTDGYVRMVAFSEVSPADLATPQSGSGYLKITVTVTHAAPAGSYRLTSIVCNLS
jgi:Tfp pilus assembly protein PilV